MSLATDAIYQPITAEYHKINTAIRKDEQKNM